MTIFLAIGGIGFLFLLISLIVGDIFEAIGFDLDFGLDASHDFGIFDSRVIGVFLTAFGGFGAIGTSIGEFFIWSARRRYFRGVDFSIRLFSFQPTIFEFRQHGRFNRAHGASRRRYSAKPIRTNFLPHR